MAVFLIVFFFCQNFPYSLILYNCTFLGIYTLHKPKLPRTVGWENKNEFNTTIRILFYLSLNFFWYFSELIHGTYKETKDIVIYRLCLILLSGRVPELQGISKWLHCICMPFCFGIKLFHPIYLIKPAINVWRYVSWNHQINVMRNAISFWLLQIL